MGNPAYLPVYWSVKVDFNRDGSFSNVYQAPYGDDVTAFVQTFTVEIGQTDPDVHVSEIGQAEIVMNNLSRVFSPANVASPYAGRLLPRLAVEISFFYGAREFNVFRGYTEEIAPEPGDRAERTVTFTCVGPLAIAQSHELDYPLVIQQRVDQNLRHVFNQAFSAPAASRRFDFAANPSNGDTITINDQTYTFVNTLTVTPNQIQIGADRYETISNTVAAITTSGASDEQYSLGTRQPQFVTAEISPSYHQKVIDGDPVRYHKFEETVGTNSNDRGGNDRDGTYVNSPTLGAGTALFVDNDYSIGLNGTNQYVALPGINPTNQSFTLEGWFYTPSAIGGTYSVVALVGTGGGTQEADMLILSSGAVQFSYFSQAVTTATGLIVPGTWYYIVCTYDYSADVSSVYINGALIATGSAGPYTGGNDASLNIGCTAPGSGQLLGNVDEVAFYLRVLTADEIADHYAARYLPPGITLYSRLSGDYGNSIQISKNSVGIAIRSPYAGELICDFPLGYFRLGETSGTTINDSSPARSTGTLLNGAVVNQAGAIAGDNNGSVLFDGVNDHATVPAYDLRNISYSVECWIKPVASGFTTNASVWQIYGGASNLNSVKLILMTDGTIKFNLGTSEIVSSAGAVAFDGVFYHVALTYDYAAQVGYIYVNGILITSGSLGRVNAAASTTILAAQFGSTNWYKGYIDEWAVYGYQLSTAQILNRYRGGRKSTLYGGVDMPNEYVDTPLALQVSIDGARRQYRMNTEAGSTVVADSIELLDGAFSGSPATGGLGALAGDPDPALYFDGIDDYVTIPTYPLISRSFSIELWVFPSALPSGRRTVFAAFNALTTGQHLRISINDTGSVEAYIYPDTIVSSTGAITPGSWYHIVFTYNTTGDSSLLYLNGALVASGNIGPYLGNFPAMYAGAREGSSEFYQGMIDELSLYPLVLTPLQVDDHYRRALNEYASYSVYFQRGSMIDFAGDDWKSGSTTALDAADDLLLTDRGWLHESARGRLVYRSRDDMYRRTNKPPILSFVNYAKVYGGVKLDQISNRVIAEVSPRATLTSGVVAKAASVVNVPGLSSTKVRLNFVDPSTGEPMAATNLILPPQPITDWRAVVTDASESDFYSNFNWLDFQTDVSGTYADVTIYNYATGTLKILDLQIRGSGLVKYNPITIDVDDLESQSLYQTRTKNIVFPLSVDLTFAENYTQWTLTKLSTPTYRAEEIEFGLVPEYAGFCLYDADIADTAEISETQTGISAALHEIMGIKYEGAVQGSIATTWSVRKIDDVSYQVLDDPNANLLDGQHLLGV